MVQTRIDFDHNATTRLWPEVRARMLPLLGELYGNPSSVHAGGRAARAEVERARGEVAALIGAEPEDIVFTSGGTEADHLALRGAALAARAAGRGGRVLVSAVEHPAVRGACAALAADGFAVDLWGVDAAGRIDPAALEALLRPDTVLVSCQLANHELGNVYPLAEIAARARARGVLVHSDAVQAVGRIPVDVRALGVDLLSLSAHKIHGPKGTGALFVRRGVALAPVLGGGHQERERRGGTENAPGIAGFGAAAAIARQSLDEWGPRVAALRDRLEAGALALPGARRHGDPARRVPGTTHLGFDGVEGEVVVIALDLEGVQASTGAACTSGSIDASPVLLALGLPRARALEGVRLSLGPDNTSAEVDRVLALLPAILERARR